MKKILLSYLVFTLLSISLCFAQPPNDNCGGTLSTTPNGTCYGPGLASTTTVGAADNWIGSVGCAGNNGEVWFSFVATGTNLAVNVTSGTMGGNIEFILVSSTAACSGFALQGSLCGASPLTGTITGLVPGTTYYYTISSTGADGTFTTCVTNTSPPPSPGQDCSTAQSLCSGSNFTNGVLNLGAGTVAENGASGWSSCIGSETSSQWYIFTASAAGAFSLLLEPQNWNAAAETGDDFDWEVYNITTSGCTNTATSLACDYSGCLGSTGFSATGAAGFPSQVANVDYDADGGGPFGCSGAPQWNATAVNLVAGNTYAVMIQNFTGSTGGVDVTFGGTAVMGPNATFTAAVDAAPCMTATVNRGIYYTGANMTYFWNFGDGFTSTAGLPAAHTYATTGFFTISLTVTDARGCTDTYSVVVNIGCLPLPIELLTFDAKPVQNTVELKWSTASETNNDYFTIERSRDAVQFSTLAVVGGAGTSLEGNTYSNVDQQPYVGLSYYRLKQTDYDGNSTYSIIKTVEFNNMSSLNFDIVPNPSQSGEFNLHFNRPFEMELDLVIMDVTGKVVYNEKLIPGNGKVFSLQKELSPGMYMLRIAGTETAITQKLIVK